MTSLPAVSRRLLPACYLQLPSFQQKAFLSIMIHACLEPIEVNSAWQVISIEGGDVVSWELALLHECLYFPPEYIINLQCYKCFRRQLVFDYRGRVEGVWIIL